METTLLSNYISEINRCILSSNIFEYDIESANACALKIIKGDHIYNELIQLPKNERVIKVGYMMKNDKDLFKKIENLLIKWRNEFIEINKIKKENIIELTRDSVLFKNSIPRITQIPDAPFVNFRTKGEEYSSYIYLKDNLRLLFDGLRKKIRIKGIDEKYVSESLFVKKSLIPTIQALEDSISIGYLKSYAGLKSIRINYLLSKDPNIYRELLNQNQILYKYNDEEIYSDSLIQDNEINIDKGSNYIHFLLPLFRLRV